MKLISLKLKNIRSYREEKIIFPDETILFEGDIGSGKSTILMAIEFALFGLGDQKGASLLKIGEKRGNVLLKFKSGNKIYEVKRSLERNKKSVSQKPGFIIDESGERQYSITELKAKILQLLQFNEKPDPKAKSRIYRYAIFTPQEEMKKIITESKEKRLDTLRKVFQIEDYEIAQEHAKNLVVELKHKKKIRDKISNRIEETEKRIESTKENYNKQKHKIMEFQEIKEKKVIEKNNLTEKLEKKREELLNLSKKENEFKSIEKQLKQNKKLLKENTIEIEKKKEFISNDIKSIDKLEEKVVELDKIQEPTKIKVDILKKDLKNLRKNKELLIEAGTQKKEYEKNLKKSRSELNKHKISDIQEISAKENEIIKILEDIEKEIQKNEDHISDLMGKNKFNINKKKEIEDNTIEIQKLKGKCPTCSRELNEKHKEEILHNYKIRKDGLNEDIEKITIEIKVLKENLNKSKMIKEKSINKHEILQKNKKLCIDLEKIEKDFKLIEQKVKKYELDLDISEKYPKWNKKISSSDFLDQLIEKQNEYEAAQKEIHLISKQLLDKKMIIKRESNEIKNKNKETEDLKSSNIKIQEDLEILKKELLRIDSVKEENETLQTLKEKIQNKLQEIEGEIGKLEGSNKELKENLDKLLKDIDKFKGELKKIDKAIDYYNWLEEFFIPTLPKIEQQMMAILRYEFNEKFQHWFSLLVEDPTKEARIDEDFTPLVEQDGFEQKIDFLSGGEKTSVALAYRLALNNTVQTISMSMKSNLLIFDEPTDGFSEHQLDKFRDILDELACPQVIFVSHKKKLEGFASKIFYINKENGVSKISEDF
ncbi:MAG: SMC family ATPase [archaeon]|nr:SMC family ATPase [archaeon]